MTCLTSLRSAHSTAGAWRRTLCVGCCPAHLPRCLVRAEECTACEGSGGQLLDDWGYEREDCRACGGTGLRAGVRE